MHVNLIINVCPLNKGTDANINAEDPTVVLILDLLNQEEQGRMIDL